MRILNDKTMKYLSFPDMSVNEMVFDPIKTELTIFVEGAFLDTNDGGILGPGVVKFNDWSDIQIRRFNYKSKEWKLLKLNDIGYLQDLCEVFLENSKVSLCGFGKSSGKWLQWDIFDSTMYAEFENANLSNDS